MSSEFYADFFNDFITESREHLETFERHALALDQALRANDIGDVIDEDIQGIFRSIHTVKGMAGMMGCEDIQTYTHGAENIVDGLRRRQFAVDRTVVDRLLEILDTVRRLFDKLAATGKPGCAADVADAVARLQEPVVSAPASKARKDGSENSATPLRRSDDRHATLRVDTSKLDALAGTVGELFVAKNQMIAAMSALTTAELQRGFGLLQKNMDHLSRWINLLQDVTIKLRMVPVGVSFKKFQRLVRDLADKAGKQIELVTEGEETEVDRSVTEHLEDPLLHILRNAIDHGLEQPEARTAAGKKATGTIRLSTRQENNMIVIEISDDGRGMVADKLFEKAAQKGFIAAETEMTEREKLNLIFLPGFSTAEKVSDISGRGVGMDVVKKNIVRLHGTCDVHSVPGAGTTFTIRLPLTLAIIPAVIAHIGPQPYAIPAANVIEAFRIERKAIEWIQGQPALIYRDAVLPIRHLNAILDIPDSDTAWTSVLVVSVGDQMLGLTVDSLKGQQEIVIKPLGSYLRELPGLAGSTILGNGQVAMVLDVVSILENELKVS